MTILSSFSHKMTVCEFENSNFTSITLGGRNFNLKKTPLKTELMITYFIRRI